MPDYSVHKEIIKRLKKKYPEDPAIANLGKAEIDRVLKIYSKNMKRWLHEGYIIPVHYFLCFWLRFERRKDPSDVEKPKGYQ